MAFYTRQGQHIPALTTDQMREVDRIAMEEFNLGILQMMENAGRNLAQLCMSTLDERRGRVVILAGSGGNGGGGISCARHLHNHGFEVSIFLSKPVDDIGRAAKSQLEVLRHAGVDPRKEDEFESATSQAALVIDAIIGYSLKGAPRGKAAELITMSNELGDLVVSLDVPSGMDSTSGETPGVFIQADMTLTLALPKRGLEHFEGDLHLGDIGIPPEVYLKLGISLEPIFDQQYVIPIQKR